MRSAAPSTWTRSDPPPKLTVCTGVDSSGIRKWLSRGPDWIGLERHHARIQALGGHRPGKNPPYTCRANAAQIRQSRPGSGLGLQVNVLTSLKLFHLRSEAKRARHQALGRHRRSVPTLPREHIRQSRPDSGLGFLAKVIKTL